MKELVMKGLALTFGAAAVSVGAYEVVDELDLYKSENLRATTEQYSFVSNDSNLNYATTVSSKKTSVNEQTKAYTANYSGTYISNDDAKAVAFLHAGVENTTFAITKFDFDDGIPEYDVEFLSGTTKMEYKIHAVTGEILEYDVDFNLGYSLPTYPSYSQTYISRENATSIALTHSGVVVEPLFTKIEMDYDDWVREYEIEFVTGTEKYDYSINAVTGEILGYGVDFNHYQFVSQNDMTGTNNTNNTNNTGTQIDSERAKAIAIEHSGVTNPSNVKIKFEYDDGIPEYEVEFRVGRMEYEYEIHALTGTILSFDMDYDD